MNSGAVPEMWKNGVAQIDAGGGASGDGTIPLSSMVTARPNAIAEPMCTRLRWVRVAPLGRPVVPDVNRIMNGSSSSMATSGRSAPVSARAATCSTRVAKGTMGTSPSVMPTSASRSSRASSPKRTLGVVSCTPYASSGPVHQPLSPTMMPPRATVAHSASAYGRLLALANATRSPLPTPYSSASTAAYAAARAGNSANVTVSSGKHEVGAIAELRHRVPEHLHQVARPLDEHLDAALRARLPRCARTARRGPTARPAAPA